MGASLVSRMKHMYEYDIDPVTGSKIPRFVPDDPFVAGYTKVSTMFSGNQNKVYRVSKDGKLFLAKAIPKSRFRLSETKIPVLVKSDAVAVPVGVTQKLIDGKDTVFVFFDYDPDSMDALDYVNENGTAHIPGQLATNMAAALATFHARGYVHGDIKLENFLVLPDLSVKLIDFGMSVRATSRAYNPGGTMIYRAPELQETGVATKESDVWSFGAALYYALTCENPAKTPRVRVPGEIGEVIRSCARKDPRDRVTMLEVLERLEHLEKDKVRPKKRPRDHEETP